MFFEDIPDPSVEQPSLEACSQQAYVLIGPSMNGLKVLRERKLGPVAAGPLVYGRPIDEIRRYAQNPSMSVMGIFQQLFADNAKRRPDDTAYRAKNKCI
jgi:hypothetical protein